MTSERRRTVYLSSHCAAWTELEHEEELSHEEGRARSLRSAKRNWLERQVRPVVTASAAERALLVLSVSRVVSLLLPLASICLRA